MFIPSQNSKIPRFAHTKYDRWSPKCVKLNSSVTQIEMTAVTTLVGDPNRETARPPTCKRWQSLSEEHVILSYLIIFPNCSLESSVTLSYSKEETTNAMGRLRAKCDYEDLRNARILENKVSLSILILLFHSLCVLIWWKFLESGAISVVRVEEGCNRTSFHYFICQVGKDPREKMSLQALPNLSSSSSFRSIEADFTGLHSSSLPDFPPEVRQIEEEISSRL